MREAKKLVVFQFKFYLNLNFKCDAYLPNKSYI